MARFYGQECRLCGVRMTDSERLFGTRHFLDEDSDLWEFSDAVMHWDCYARWEHRARFARLYFEANREWSRNSRHWGVARSDEQLLVKVNPSQFISEASVMLAETGSITLALADWEDWLAGEWEEHCEHEIEREALAAAIPLLRTQFPTAAALVAAAGMEAEAGADAEPPSGIVAQVLHQLAWRKLAARAATKGLACPGCGHFSTEYEYVEVEIVSEAGPPSHLVCRACGKEFGPADV